MQQLTITIDDPATIDLLGHYAAYLARVDEVDASINQLAEGLMLGMLDEHWQFHAWRRASAGAATEVGA